MKYIVFVIGLIVLVVIGAFLWSAASDIFVGDFSLIGMPDLGTSTVSEPSTSVDTEPVTEPVGGQTQPTTGNGSEPEQQETTPPPSTREGSVRISGYSNFSSNDNPQTVRLSTNLNQGEAVNITGWTIKTNESEVTIPQGVSFYEVSEINDESDIVLSRGDFVTIYFDERPVPDNLRLNKCIGYLNDIYDLGFFFPENCPMISSDSYKHLSGECQDIIRGLGRCENPSTSEMSPLSSGGERSEECRDFIRDNFNAGACYENYRDDEDFLDNEWRIWIDESRVLDENHDWIRLINDQGEVIDERNY